MSRRSSQQAFTIVELLIVIVVIAILAAITIIAFNGIQERAHGTSLKSDLSQARKQLQIDQLTTGNYPATITAADEGRGLKSSSGNSFQYTSSNTSNPQSFCLTATWGNLIYHINQTGFISSGACAGHSGDGGGSSGVYAIGDTGPAGGKVFYDKGDASDGWQYLEAAPSDQGSSVEWGCFGTTISGADGKTIGTGKQNTADILSDCSQSDIAARVADSYSLGGYNDWFLPSENELIELHQQKSVVGGIDTNRYYWSSTESQESTWASSYWAVDVVDGEPWYSNDKTDLWLVRPIRSF